MQTSAILTMNPAGIDNMSDEELKTQLIAGYLKPCDLTLDQLLRFLDKNEEIEDLQARLSNERLEVNSWEETANEMEDERDHWIDELHGMRKKLIELRNHILDPDVKMMQKEITEELKIIIDQYEVPA